MPRSTPPPAQTSLPSPPDGRGEWDVVVVGAGPAGTSAARAAAARGATVLLVDRAVFPRYKTCGGGLLGESLELLPERARAAIESEVAESVFTHRFRRPFRLRQPAPYLAMVRRADFDQALADAAQDAGARFADGVAVREVAETDDGALVQLRTSAGAVSAHVVIGADGTGGRVGRYVGVTPGGVDLGLEDEVAMPADATPWRDHVLLDWGGASGSYAWVFPKRDSLTVGVIQRRGAPDETRAYLTAWREHLGLAGPDAVTLHSSGHLTQWRTPSSPLRRGGVVVAGDAAGLLEPWTREGISFALRSGTWAGEAAASAAVAHTSTSASTRADAPATDAARRARDTALDAYEARVTAVLAPEQAAGATILKAFERRPGLIHALLRTPAGARYFVRFCRGETTLARIGRHRHVMRLLRALA